MHALLARALEMGTLAHGLGDASGSRLEVEDGGGVLRAEVRTSEGASAGIAWTWPPRSERPERLPDDVPFLPGLPGAAVLDGGGLTVTWPAPPTELGAQGVPGLAGAMGGGLGAMVGPSGPTGADDPVASAWQRYTAEGEAGDRGPALVEGFKALLEQALDEGWTVLDRTHLEGALEARVVRLRRGDAERSLTLSRALGVSSLVMLEKPGGETGTGE